jgi:hypothetical protein
LLWRHRVTIHRDRHDERQDVRRLGGEMNESARICAECPADFAGTSDPL